MSELPRLLGRDHELRLVETLLAHARNGNGGALLLAGDPGIGKTALLEAATSELVGMEVLRADGYEAESTIPYAALQRLMIPLRSHLAALPEWHRRALRVAAGTAEGPPPDRFLVGLGVLGLLAAAGEDRPVVCAVDDAHLLDSESLDALAFVARRLEAEAAVVVFASRDAAHVETQLTGVPRLRVPGLAPEPAVMLLASSLPAPMDPAAAAQIADATGGNPLALIDLATELSVKRLAESSLADEPLPIGPRLETFYLQRVRSLAAEAQLWLLIAAADSTGNLALIRAAGEELGVSGSASETAETAGLVELGGTARFRHPLVRSAAYGAATGAERRRVHAALASAAAELTLVELEAWHAAKATLGTDTSVADRLERVADLAGQRGGFSSRASVLVQAAGLTPDGSRKQARLVAAAEATLATGAAQLARSMLGEVDQDTLDPLSRARMVAVRASVAMFTADPALRTSTAEMLTVWETAHGHDVAIEQDSLIQAFYFLLPTERLALGLTLPELGKRLQEGADLREGAAASILRGLSAFILLPYRDAVPLMREGVETIKGLDDIGMLRYGAISVVLTSALWDAAGWRECLERTASVAREVGSLRLLDVTLWARSMAELRIGTPRRAGDYLDQVRELRRAIGYDAEHVTNPALLAWSGAPVDEVRRVADAARMAGVGALHAAGMTALAARELADGAYAEAYLLLKPFVNDPFLHVTPLEYPDFVEAAVRSGRTDEAVPVVELLEDIADGNGSSWAAGMAARSRALVQDSEPHFQTALSAVHGSGVDIELGRTHLLYGEWLRRKRKRRMAADHLHRAAAIFERGQAPAFARRARRELEALGEAPRPSSPVLPGGPGLTSQEITVARLAASGKTNAEIGATMFLSVNTVDYHLRKVFQKLGISSRRQLADKLAGAQV
jgi:DNA-binding CsgD family transcriptional regulator